MRGILPSISSSTCAAVVGLGRPERFALGAAMGVCAAQISARATGCEGMRTATVSSPAVTSRGTRGDLGKISVMGPGQKARMSARAQAQGSSAIRPARPLSPAMCAISGLSAGRPLAAKMRADASAFSASAPRPYTVSVGKATNSPARSSAAARRMLASSAWQSSVCTIYASLSIRAVCSASVSAEMISSKSPSRISWMR